MEKENGINKENKMDKLINLLNDLADRYNFSDEDIAKINDVLYGNEDEKGLFGDEYVGENEYGEDDYEGEEFDEE